MSLKQAVAQQEEEIEELRALLLSATESATRDRESLEGEKRILNAQLDELQLTVARLERESLSIKERFVALCLACDCKLCRCMDCVPG